MFAPDGVTSGWNFKDISGHYMVPDVAIRSHDRRLWREVVSLVSRWGTALAVDPEFPVVLQAQRGE